MAWTLAEGIVKEVIDHLDADLAAKLNTLDTEYNDGITLTDPIDIVYTDPELPTGGAMLAPRIHVIASQTRMQEWRQTTVRGEHDVVIWVTAQDPDLENLRKRIYRYGRAIFEVMVAGHFDSSITWNMIGLPIVDFGAILTRNSMAAADCTLQTTLIKLETA